MAWSFVLISRRCLMSLPKLALRWRLRGTAPAGSPPPPGPENHPRHQHEQVTGGHDRPLGLRTACRLHWTGSACAPGDAGVVTTWRTRGLPPAAACAQAPVSGDHGFRLRARRADAEVDGGREIAVVSAFLGSVPRGPRALLVEGEAGIGKSTVWFESVRLAEARGYDAAVAAYRLSAQAGKPLSERKLAQMCGRTSRRRARPESPKHGEPRLHRSPRIRQSPSAPNPNSAPRKDPPRLRTDGAKAASCAPGSRASQSDRLS